MPGQKTVLIVDDDADFAESNKDLLESAGYRVLVEHQGAAGLATARRERPDLMILDVMMAHDTEGFEVSRKIPLTPELRGMKVLLVTGIRKARQLDYGFEPDATWLPVDRVLEKPVPPEALLDAVRKSLFS
jgi:CheY-like chemotaxis protein